MQLDPTECPGCHKFQQEIEHLFTVIEVLKSNQELGTKSPLTSLAVETPFDTSQEIAKHANEANDLSTAPESSLVDQVLSNNTEAESEIEVDVSSELSEDPTTPSIPPVIEHRIPLRRHSVTLQLSALEHAPPPPPIPEQPRTRHYAPRHSISELESSNQIYHEQSFYSFLGHTDKDTSSASLDALFKYAIVLAGPSPAKPRRNFFAAISDRLRGADFRRTRSMPEGQQLQRQDPSSTELTTFGIDSSTPTKAKAQAGGGLWLTRSRMQPPGPTLELVTEEPTPVLLSPQKRSGWFSNLMTNGLRGGSGNTTPLSPGSALSPARTPAEAPETPKANAVASKMLAIFPPPVTDSPEVPELEGLVEICFPYGDKLPQSRDYSLPQLRRTLQERHRTFRSADATFVLTLASTSAASPSEMSYAICVRCPLFPDDDDQARNEDLCAPSTLSVPLPAQCCICLVTPFPFFNLFFKVLYGIAVLWDIKRRNHNECRASLTSTGGDDSSEGQDVDSVARPLGMKDFIAHFHGVMERLREMKFPPMGGWSRMVLSPAITPLSFHRPHCESADQERRVLLLEYAAPILFGLLSVDQVLFLLGCLCCERKVLLVSEHVNMVSACVLALTTLLHPLQWAGPVITVLPPRLEELLEAPVPLIAGRVSTTVLGSDAPQGRPMNGVIEIDMDRNDLRMHDEDMMMYHELKLPDCDELVHELRPHAEQLFQKLDDLDFPSAQQAEACERLCARIHNYIASICAQAVGDVDTKASDDALGDLSSPRRNSELTGAFVDQLRETQMFSDYRLLHQDHIAEEESGEDDSFADDDDSDTNVEDQ